MDEIAWTNLLNEIELGDTDIYVYVNSEEQRRKVRIGLFNFIKDELKDNNVQYFSKISLLMNKGRMVRVVTKEEFGLTKSKFLDCPVVDMRGF